MSSSIATDSQAISIATDFQGRFLTRAKLETAQKRYQEVAAALEAAKHLNENAEQLIHDAAEAVYKKFPYTTQLSEHQYASTPEGKDKCARDIGYYLKMIISTATLTPLTELEARELIASSPIPFAEADIQWMLQESECWPLLLQIFCRERLFSLEEGDSSDAWREEALGQIQQYQGLKF